MSKFVRLLQQMQILLSRTSEVTCVTFNIYMILFRINRKRNEISHQNLYFHVKARTIVAASTKDIFQNF